MKKKLFAVLAVAVLMLSASEASAFIHFTQNEFTTAESLDEGLSQTGIHLTFGEDYTSFYPVFRYGLGSLAEVGVKGGATSVDYGPDKKLGGLLGVDLKYQLIKETESIPLDMAIDLGFDNTLVSRRNVSELTFSTILSRGFPLIERGYKLTPYGGLEMSSIYGSGVPKNETSLYGFIGLEWKLSQKFMILVEYKGGESNLGGFGIRFEY
jgi:hypothetical protein